MTTAAAAASFTHGTASWGFVSHKATAPHLLLSPCCSEHRLLCCGPAPRASHPPPKPPVQVWPIILSGHDLIGIAATGSGKTLGFGLPMLRHIKAQRNAGVVTGKGPIALVMAPTRELALQIAAVLEDAGSKCGISSVCVYGGVPKGPQVAALRSGVDIVVGTPGRLEDLMQDGACKLQVGAIAAACCVADVVW